MSRIGGGARGRAVSLSRLGAPERATIIVTSPSDSVCVAPRRSPPHRARQQSERKSTRDPNPLIDVIRVYFRTAGVCLSTRQNAHGDRDGWPWQVSRPRWRARLRVFVILMGPGDLLPMGSAMFAYASTRTAGAKTPATIGSSMSCTPLPSAQPEGAAPCAHKLVTSFAHATARGTSVTADGPPMRSRNEERGSKPYCFSMMARVSTATSDMPGVPR